MPPRQPGADREVVVAPEGVQDELRNEREVAGLDETLQRLHLSLQSEPC